MANKASPEVQSEAERTANATKRPGQTKEQTRIIRQGIEKGIAEYKKQQKAKARERDKQRKREQQQQQAERQAQAKVVSTDQAGRSQGAVWLPWALLATSWIGFGVYLWLSRGLG